MDLQSNILKFRKEIESHGATLVAISKTHPVDAIRQAYEAGIRDFGENKVQEMIGKKDLLPEDIRWHMVGHLQSNKVKQIVPFVHLIHGVDSLSLLKEIEKGAAKIGRKVSVLLQVRIAEEETKFGLSFSEAEALLIQETGQLRYVRIEGLMGMATFTKDLEKVRREFKSLRTFFTRVRKYDSQTVAMHVLSMGMSGDFEVALEEGSTMVRIGSAIFGERNYQKV